ncbi:MAG: signal peptidase II [Thermoleophilia bacterium]|nr:signal peptidase II [Thermoleophilia bacterium]
MPSPESRVAAGLIALAALAADQLAKWLVRGADALPYDLVGGAQIVLVYNTGVSFGRLRDLGGLLVAGVAVLVVCLTVAMLLAPGRYRVGLALILGGAAGNLVDRLRFDGAVLDFFDTPWWPAFNLADAFIVAGVGVVLLAVLRGARA